MTKEKIDILLIEDEPDLGEFFSRYLRYKGFTVLWENTAEGGWENFQRVSVKLLIIDIQLPDGNGFDLAQRMIASNPGQPVFFLTALHERNSRLKGLSLGAVDYIVKPFDMDEILLKIRNLLKVASVSNKDALLQVELQIGNLRLNMERFTLDNGLKQVQKLTVREAELLHFLILNKICW